MTTIHGKHRLMGSGHIKWSSQYETAYCQGEQAAEQGLPYKNPYLPMQQSGEYACWNAGYNNKTTCRKKVADEQT